MAVTCPICAYAKAHGSWSPELSGSTHCGDSRRAGVVGCHRTWKSTSQAHCTICHEQFASNGIADLHWTKAGHVHPSEVKKLEPHKEALGIVWRSTGDGRPGPWSAQRGGISAPQMAEG